MARIVTLAIAQMGPIPLSQPRQEVVARLIAMLEDAARMGADLVVFTEAALTAFFPHWLITDEAELDSFYETAMPNPAVQALFDAAGKLGVGFHLGYAELDASGGRKRRFNTSVLVGKDGGIIGKYRKIHLPGFAEPDAARPFQNLEKRYFEVGDLGFPVWEAFGGRIGMMICNDRRWPESYRVMGLQGVEMIVLGYNTPTHDPALPESDDLGLFHNQLVMQAGAYQNACFVAGVAKAGVEEGVDQIGGSCVIAPSGEVIARCTSLADEVQVARCDLDLAQRYKASLFNFARHRRPEHYRMIVERTGAADALGGTGEYCP